MGVLCVSLFGAGRVRKSAVRAGNWRYTNIHGGYEDQWESRMGPNSVAWGWKQTFACFEGCARLLGGDWNAQWAALLS